MYSKARVAGHPIHPMLIAFPVALYTATVVALFAYLGTHDAFWFRVAMWASIAGAVMAGVAAIPGLIDLVSLPRRTRVRSTGIRHAAFNVLSLSLFVITAVILSRGAASASAGTYVDIKAPLALSILGVLGTMAAGWLGWTLVQTHHVGVKPSEDLQRSQERDLADLDAIARGEQHMFRGPRDTDIIRH